MAVCYNRLWKLLIDKNMKKMDLVEKIGISSSTLAKMSKGESVSMNVMEKICKNLDCDFAEGFGLSVLPRGLSTDDPSGSLSGSEMFVGCRWSGAEIGSSGGLSGASGVGSSGSISSISGSSGS